MESDPVYKMLENLFYKEFDEHIMRHTNGIGSVIASYQAERDYVKNRIQQMA